MKEIKKVCEQLGYAGRLLDNHTVTEDRLALILIDNIVDFLLYHAVKGCFEQLNSSWMFADSRLGKSAQKNILRSFPSRCEFLESPPKAVVGPTLSADESQTIQEMHKLRNETYHEGTIRDNVIRPMVHAFAALIPPVLAKLWSGIYSFDSRSKEDEQFMLSFEITGSGIDRDVFQKFCRKSLGEVNHSTITLAVALITDISNRIAVAQSMFKYATATGNFTGDEVFKWSEFWDWAYEQKSFDWKDQEVNRKQRQFFDQHYKQFNPKRNLSLFTKMLKSLEGISTTGSDAVNLVLYWRIDKELSPMEDFIRELAISYEQHIENQIDMMREER